MELSAERRARLRRMRERMLVPPEICAEKAYYMTRSYRETEGEPECLRRARALDAILSGMTAAIGEDEMIVGRTTSKTRGGAISPEVNSTWYLDELDLFSERSTDRFAPIPEEDKRRIREIVPYWRGRSVYDRWLGHIPPELRKVNNLAIAGSCFSGNTQYFGHLSVDYGRILRLGTKGILAEIEAAQSGLTNLGDLGQFERHRYLESMRIAVGALEKFARRYARLAASMAASERDPRRRAELERIASVCLRVPENPARTFHEAIQSAWFAFAAIMIESWGSGPSLTRPDQYLYPYYLKDIREGTSSVEEIQELISMFYIKCNECLIPYSTVASKTFGGLALHISITLGGLDAAGNDAVNDLSYLFLDAELDSALTEDIVVRVGEKTPEPFLVRACEVAKAVRGKVKFVGEDTIIRQMLDDGRTLEMARDCVVTGCNSPGVPGRSLDVPGGIISLPLILELALNDGVSRMTGLRLGPPTGDAREFASFDRVWAAFIAQFEAMAPTFQMLKNVDKMLFGEFLPSPLQSSLYNGCVERGVDVIRGGTYPHLSFAFSLAGAPNVGDSLAAIKKLVFDERRVAMRRLVDALDADFAGDQELERLLKGAPKFGNDLEYVDILVDRVLSACSDILAATPGYAGAKSFAAAAAITANIVLGREVGALPDGRKAGLPLAEGGISPHQGRNVNGPTATLMSVAKLDHTKLKNGSVLNMRFDPQALKGAEKTRKFASLLRTFFGQGGFLVQFNFVDTQTLKEAQRHPEQYRDLLVRVATYSSFFTELSETLQDDIIDRVEFESL